MRKIGWIGAGIMGQPMVIHLLNKGYEVHVYARHPERVEQAKNAGAILEESIVSLTSNVDVICTMVGFPSDVKEVYDVIFSCIDAGKTCIDFTTSSPKLAKELYTKGKELGVHVLDAPVTGGDTGAKNGTLTVLVGADKEDFETNKEIFEAFGTQIEYCGKVSCGQHVKMANQIMIANTLQGICEAMSYLNCKDVDESFVYRFLRNGAAGSKQLEFQGKKMLENDYAPGFYVKHFVKDLKIAVQEANFPLYGVNRVIKEYVDLMDRGMSDLGTQCLIEYFRKPQIKAVIFDMDGLMFNTEKMFKDEFKEKAKELGVSCPDSFPEPLIGCDSRKVAEFEIMYPGVTRVMEEIQEERADYFFTYFKEPGSANMVGLQNLIEYIEENKIPYAVASSSHPQDIKKFLSHAGFVLSPNVIVSSKEGYKSKPAPDVFLAAAERLDVKPENCLVLEDSKHGIMAAANAKMHSIFIQDQIAPDDEMKEYIQESCTDLNGVIDYLKRCK